MKSIFKKNIMIFEFVGDGYKKFKFKSYTKLY